MQSGSSSHRAAGLWLATALPLTAKGPSLLRVSNEGMRGVKRGENEEPDKLKMTTFQKAEALAGQRSDRDKLLVVVDEVTTHFRMPNSFERSKMRAVCRYLADALDRCRGSTLQRRWNDFEKRFWPKWKSGVDRHGREYWTWGARVLIPARMIVPSLNMLSDLQVNQWIAHLPEDHRLAQQHRSLLQATDSITWTSAHSRQLAVSNGLRILLMRGYDSLHHITI